jgi:hypothetical protein
LHACYLLGAKRVVDLRADPGDRDKAGHQTGRSGGGALVPAR